MAKKPKKARQRRGATTIDPRKTYRVSIRMQPHETVRHLGVRGIDHCCMPQPRRHEHGSRMLHAYASGAAILALRRKGRKVKVLAETAKEGKEAQKNVSDRDRFGGGTSGPPGVGEFNPDPEQRAPSQIMNVHEIASALAYFSSTFPDLCRTIELPEKTHENRTSHALRIGKQEDAPTVLVTGGMHAREWGGPDIVVNFADDLLRAYTAGAGLRYGRKCFGAREIAQIVETMNVVVFPCVNPDGVQFSHTDPHNHYWRKNRNPESRKGDRPGAIGVDINRNFDFLWDYKRHFHPASYKDDNSVGSTSPREETFSGTAPFSEPETRNVKWLMDQLPKLALFMDLHSYEGDVLYGWGDDLDQSADPAMNFRNPDWDGKRGRMNDAYGEYLSQADTIVTVGIAAAVAQAMRDVRGAKYTAKPSVGLYPNAGTCTDYCFARHILDPEKPKTFSYTIEFNFGKKDKAFTTPGDPEVLDATIRDVIPGLIAFCLAMPNALAQAPACVSTPRS